MTPLIDGDILRHEIGWAGQKTTDGKVQPMDWEFVKTVLDNKILLICGEVDATQPPIIFLSDSPTMTNLRNKAKRWTDVDYPHDDEFIPNFRYARAVTKPYKGGRKLQLPYHFYNLTLYMLSNYKCIVSRGGLEADDEMSIYQCSVPDTIICSRDKDLRICPGWHYSWECGKQNAVFPEETDRVGKWVDDIGYGLKFFYYQMLVGDTADNIPGLMGFGPVKARQIVEACNTELELFEAVLSTYYENSESKEAAETLFKEQADLLWIWQERERGYVLPRDL